MFFHERYGAISKAEYPNKAMGCKISKKIWRNKIKTKNYQSSGFIF